MGTNGFSFRTADGGTTWTETSTGIGVDFTGIAMVDPSNAIAVGTGRFGQAPVVPRAYRTSDAGASWVAIPTGPRGDLAAIAARPGGGFAVAAPGASTFSSSDGTTWAAPVDEARSPSTLRGLSTSGSHVVAVGDGGSVRTSRDGGVRWAESAMPVPADLRAVDSIDAKIWAVGSLRDDVVGIVHPVVLHSTDDGGSWTPIGTGLPAARRLNAVRFVDPLRGWVVGAGPAGSGAGFIAATTDGGHTWSVVAQTGPRELTSLEVIDDRLWAVGPKAYVRSDDGGETWVVAAEGTDVPIPAPSLASIDFIDGVHGWIGAADRILATSDGGITWTQLENPFGASLLHVRFTNQLEGWATGHDGSLRRTIDGGTTWSSRWIPSTRASDELTSLTIDGSGALWVTLASTVAVVPARRPSAVELRANAPTGEAHGHGRGDRPRYRIDRERSSDAHRVGSLRARRHGAGDGAAHGRRPCLGRGELGTDRRSGCRALPRRFGLRSGAEPSTARRRPAGVVPRALGVCVRRCGEPGSARTTSPRPSEARRQLASRRAPQLAPTWPIGSAIATAPGRWARSSGCTPGSSPARPTPRA